MTALCRLSLLAALALSAVLVGVPTVHADGCRRAVSAPAYASGYAPGYQAQAVSYGHGYQQAYGQNYDIVYQPYAIPVAILPATFYAVAPELAYARVNQELARQAADEAADKAARKALQDLLNIQRIPSQPPPATGGNDPRIPPADPQAQAPPKAGAGDLLGAVKGLVNAKCLKCHGPGSDFDLSDLSRLTRDQRLEIVYRVMTDDPKVRMPKTGPAVTGEELNAFHAFVQAAPGRGAAGQK